jgi:hypothetical protein
VDATRLTTIPRVIIELLAIVVGMNYIVHDELLFMKNMRRAKKRATASDPHWGKGLY